jgi:hypothetical protein
MASANLCKYEDSMDYSMYLTRQFMVYGASYAKRILSPLFILHEMSITTGSGRVWWTHQRVI